MSSAPDTTPISDNLIIEKRPVPGGQYIGLLTLNAPSSLNALTAHMIEGLLQQLQAWRTDEHVVCVVLRGVGERAFCAGGDINHLYQAAVAANGQAAPDNERFFEQEYRVDYLIHTYPKPIVCLGHGFVMGGGIGLMAGCSHRIVTERTRMAMPEITIGLFPDVGGTWFLSRMPAGTGLFLGLTGAHCNAADAIDVGWADAFLPSSQLDAFVEALQRVNWTSPESNHTRITQVLRAWQEQHLAQCPKGNIAQHQSLIREIAQYPTLEAVCQAILSLPAPDAWWEKAQKSLEQGCPVTAHLVWWQITEGRKLSLPEVFRHELVLAVNCTRHPNFREGVRALLIDKDNAPQWTVTQIQGVKTELLHDLHTAPWAEHPLADLGA
ncbi:MAG: enoyl-CoA hydratase/isomerase family protein [Hahellaceae bacterium]|nr:enoyl-CoA hydratase/isomerase family protein [Hahellaceae bacterium]